MEVDKDNLLSSAKFAFGLVVPKDNENIDAVLELFTYLSTPEYLDIYFGDEAGFPGFEGINGGDMQEDVKTLYEENEKAGTLVAEMNLHWGEIEPLFNDTLWTYYHEALAKGNMDGRQILDKFQADVDKFLAENNK